MPYKSKVPCKYPNCGKLIPAGTMCCEEHAAIRSSQYEKYGRDKNTKRRYGRAWKRIRDKYASEHPFCEQCYAKGIESSTDTTTSDSTDSSSTDDPETSDATVIGNTKEQTLNISLPVTWIEDGQAVVTFTFEFNDEEILTHYSVETWHSGKHTILLYYPIEDVVANYTNTFNVYMKVEGGSGTVDIGGCIASISGQSMGADAAWDGKLEIEESVGRFAFGNGSLSGRIRPIGFTESTSWEINELVQRAYSDVVSGKTAVGAFCKPVDMD